MVVQHRPCTCKAPTNIHPAFSYLGRGKNVVFPKARFLTCKHTQEGTHTQAAPVTEILTVESPGTYITSALMVNMDQINLFFLELGLFQTSATQKTELG